MQKFSLLSQSGCSYLTEALLGCTVVFHDSWLPCPATIWNQWCFIVAAASCHKSTGKVTSLSLKTEKQKCCMMTCSRATVNKTPILDFALVCVVRTHNKTSLSALHQQAETWKIQVFTGDAISCYASVFCTWWIPLVRFFLYFYQVFASLDHHIRFWIVCTWYPRASEVHLWS